MLALGLLSTALAQSEYDSCMWCVSYHYTWSPELQKCDRDYQIKEKLDCFSHNQQPQNTRNIVIDKSTFNDTSPYIELISQWDEESVDHREQLINVKNKYGKSLLMELTCIEYEGVVKPSGMVAFVALGPDTEKLVPIYWGCGSAWAFKLKASQYIARIDLIVDYGEETGILRITPTDEDEGETVGLIVGSIMGGASLLATISFGIYCCISSKRQNTYKALARGR
ncbi:hypothetical protein FGO68_gene951 [Halteria grandinella]|uniref:Uncharacterized protein n=1 Tax=Halteria grandinella TaxID=5974 RepID=A0A8J8T116_HALGN|nr:hypothetical protein FGO68_gene951 [Halteria grandinella]